MSQKASDDEVCQALLDYVTNGTYPSSDGVVVSEFSSSALSKELDLISQAREQVEVSRTALCDSMLNPRLLGGDQLIESRK